MRLLGLVAPAWWRSPARERRCTGIRRWPTCEPFAVDKYECMRDTTAASGPATVVVQNTSPTYDAADAWNQGVANGQAIAQARNYNAGRTELFNACMEARGWQLRAAQ